MTMKRLMILAAMLAATACGDDSSSDDNDTTDDDSNTTTKDAGKDAGKDATSSTSKDAGGDDCDSLTYDSFGEAFMTKYCSECHAESVTGSARKGAPDEDVFDTLKQIQDDKDELYNVVVDDKSMPFPTAKTKLAADSAEREKFGKWLDCGPN